MIKTYLDHSPHKIYCTLIILFFFMNDNNVQIKRLNRTGVLQSVRSLFTAHISLSKR